MTNLEGVRITLDPGGSNERIFRGLGNLSIQVEHQSDYILAGGDTVIAGAQRLFEKLGSGDTLQTPLATGHLGLGGGTRVFELAFDQWEGNSDAWGPANDGDPPDEKLAVLEQEIAQEGVTSLNPARLEFGPYHDDSGSRYGPIKVVFPSISPVVDFGDGPSIFRSRVTCQETIDLDQVVDGATQLTPDFRLTPAGESSPRLPIPADTLGAGGRGTGAQRQGKDAARQALVDPNGSGSDPASTPTKILPSEVRLRGAFRGDAAPNLADQLKQDFLTDPSVNKVDLEAPERVAPNPLAGRYTLGGDSAIDPLTPQIERGVYGFDLQLIQG